GGAFGLGRDSIHGSFLLGSRCRSGVMAIITDPAGIGTGPNSSFGLGLLLGLCAAFRLDFSVCRAQLVFDTGDEFVGAALALPHEIIHVAVHPVELELEA